MNRYLGVDEFILFVNRFIMGVDERIIYGRMNFLSVYDPIRKYS